MQAAGLTGPDVDTVGYAGHMYLDLLKKSLLNELYLDNELRLTYLLDCVSTGQPFDPQEFIEIKSCRPKQFDRLSNYRQAGWVEDNDLAHAPYSHTMIGRARLENLQSCALTALAENVPGDFMECGVWRGGAAILMKAILSLVQEESRSVWLADSFKGLPVPSRPEDEGFDLSAAKYPLLAVGRDTVERTFRDYGLLDERVHFVEGWFKDSLPELRVRELALLRVDGDLYESTMDVLTALYDRVSLGGFLIVDDYGLFEPCRQAVDEFRERRGIEEPIHKVDWTGVYWRKTVTR